MNRLKLVAAVLVILVIGGGLWGYWRYSERYPSTDDAYVGAHVVTVAAQTTGQVTAVHVVENQSVAAGDPLFELDATLYRNALASAEAQVDAARQSEASLQAEADAARAAVTSASAASDVAQTQLQRVQTLVGEGTVSRAQLDQANSDAVAARASLDGARAELARAQAGIVTNRDTLLQAEADRSTAETNLARTRVAAPVAGWVANVSLRPGTVVSAYQPLFSIVSDEEWWIDANFRETDLQRIREGQPVSVAVDMLPGTQMTGRVGSISRGSGATFALLPPENASGNWVRVVQRFPVRILLDDPDPRLRAGASSTVRVDTTGTEDERETRGTGAGGAAQ